MRASARKRTSARTADDAGFTLIELVVVTAVLPVVVGALSLGIVTLLTLQQGTSNRISDAADAQVSSSHYEQDVQSAANLTTSATATQCGSGTQLLGLEWNLNQQSGQYQSVVSYVAITKGSSTSLVRQYCSAGASATPTVSRVVSADIQPGLTPTIAPATKSTSASAGWTSTVGVTGVTFAIVAPLSNYSYTLFSVPKASSSAGQLTGVSPGSASCGFATPGTGTYASTLCYVDFSSYNFRNTSGPCQAIVAAIVGTPYTLSLCLSTTTTPSQGSGPPCLSTTAPSIPATVVPCPLPTYFSPPASEAFLGNNGFYTGVPGDPALYQNAEGSSTSISITNIQVLDSNGRAATGWELVAGDAESTDSGESITWSSDQLLSLLPNSPTSAYGNACAAPTPGSGLTGVGTSQVRCTATVDSDKTGTVMLVAPAPSRLSVDMVGTGLQAVFVGVLLP